MARKRTKKRAKRTHKRGRRKMSALQRKYFGKGHGAVGRRRKKGSAKRSRARTRRSRARKVIAVRAVVRKSEKGLRHRVKKLEHFMHEQKTLNTKQHHFNAILAHGLDRVFSHTGLKKPHGLRAPSVRRLGAGR